MRVATLANRSAKPLPIDANVHFMFCQQSPLSSLITAARYPVDPNVDLTMG